MNWLGGILLVFAPFARAEVLPVFDKDFACTESTKADQYVNDFQVDIDSFGGPELCNSKVDSKKLFNDFSLIEQGHFSAPTKQNMFVKNFVPSDSYYQWMKNETAGMRRGNDEPTASAYNSMGYFTMQDGWSKSSTLGRVGTVLHEARHTAGYPHYPCTRGPYAGNELDGCDTGLEESGAHAVEMEYYARVTLEGENFHPVYQSMARLMLLARANFVFNDNPMTEHEGLAALTDKGLIRLDGNGGSVTLPLVADLPLNAMLKRTSFGATVLNLPGEAWALDLLDSNPQAKLSDDYSYFKLLKMTPPNDLQDIEEVDFGTRRYFFAADKNAQLFSYVFGEGAWSSPMHLAGFQSFHTVTPNGDQGIFARLSPGTYCELDHDTLACKGATKPWPSTVRNYVKFRNETLALGTDGVVRKSDGSPLPELQGMSVSGLVSIPEYDVFE